jgi:hypothetical protein
VSIPIPSPCGHFEAATCVVSVPDRCDSSWWAVIASDVPAQPDVSATANTKSPNLTSHRRPASLEGWYQVVLPGYVAVRRNSTARRAGKGSTGGLGSAVRFDPVGVSQLPNE